MRRSFQSCLGGCSPDGFPCVSEAFSLAPDGCPATKPLANVSCHHAADIFGNLSRKLLRKHYEGRHQKGQTLIYSEGKLRAESEPCAELCAESNADRLPDLSRVPRHTLLPKSRDVRLFALWHRLFASGAKGRWFESTRAYQQPESSQILTGIALRHRRKSGYSLGAIEKRFFNSRPDSSPDRPLRDRKLPGCW